MDKSVFVIYEGDEWLSTDSLRVKSVCGSFEDAVDVILKNNNSKENDRAIETELRNHKQTFGDDVRYLIEEMGINEWI